MKSITIESLKKLGKDKVSTYAGCINANYLCYMGGSYSLKSLEKGKAREKKRVEECFDEYIKSVVEAINSEQTTTTEKFLNKEYINWFSIKN